MDAKLTRNPAHKACTDECDFGCIHKREEFLLTMNGRTIVGSRYEIARIVFAQLLIEGKENDHAVCSNKRPNFYDHPNYFYERS